MKEAKVTGMNKESHMHNLSL